MRRIIIFLILVFVLFFGCDQAQFQNDQSVKRTSQQTPVAAVEKTKVDVSAILKKASELREEKIFLVTLEFKKEQFTLDFFQHVKNAMNTEYRTIIVSESTFNKYKLGEKVSSVNDGWGFFFKGELSRYVIRTYKKKIKRQYFWIDREGQQTQISQQEYKEVLNQLSKTGRQFITVPFAGIVRTYILQKPLSEYKFTSRQPLRRYFVTVKVENSTFTLSLFKHIRNAANTHEITLEVPRSVYEKTGDIWDAQLSQGSFMLKGHLSELRGKVIKKWSEVDNDYELVKTDEGREFIVPKEK